PSPTVGADAGAGAGSQQTLSVLQPVTSQDLTPSPSVNNASPTIDKTETVDQSPDPPNDDVLWDVTGSPTERPPLYSQEIALSSSLSPIQNDVIEEEMLPSTAGSNQSSSSHIEVSGILISIDGVPTLEPNTKPSSLRSSRTDKTVSLGPVGISSILHEIISTSMLQTNSEKTIHVNISDIQGLISSSSPIPVEQLPTSLTSPSNDNISQQQAIGHVTRNSERAVSSPSPPPLLSEDKKHDIYHGPLESSDPYAHWDSDSEEQEHEMELQRLQELPKEELEHDDDDSAAVRTVGSTVDVDVGPPTSPSSSAPTNGRSYLLLLAGNSTIVQLRQKDFAKYLKLNLAARLSLEYDDVRVNRVVLAPPQLLVNVSVVTPAEAAAATSSEEVISEAGLDDAILKEEEPLHMLAETNATLLELSGEEYHVVRLLSLHSHPSEKKLEFEGDLPSTSTIISDRQSNTELIIYTAVGSVCALVILAILFMTFSRYMRTLHVQWPWQRPKYLYSSWTLPSSHLRHRRMNEYPAAPVVPPTVIYSGSFAARAANSWVDEYQSQPSSVVADDAGSTAMLGVGALKFPAGNPLYTDLEMGGAAGNVIMGHNAETLSMQRHQSPSKLHMFSCRPGSIVIPAALPHHQLRRNLKVTKDSHPLDVRIGEDCKLGHDNPNYIA
ncbi:hypothetical protein Cfor_03803, partial [Coptotermes formosanus]